VAGAAPSHAQIGLLPRHCHHRQPAGPQADAVEKAVKAARASRLYLPKYSPDLNPIEQAFGKLKGPLRKAAERTVPGLWRRIGKLLATFSAKECKKLLQTRGLCFYMSGIRSKIHISRQSLVAVMTAEARCGLFGNQKF
jgi:hypothetical protein